MCCVVAELKVKQLQSGALMNLETKTETHPETSPQQSSLHMVHWKSSAPLRCGHHRKNKCKLVRELNENLTMQLHLTLKGEQMFNKVKPNWKWLKHRSMGDWRQPFLYFYIFFSYRNSSEVALIVSTPSFGNCLKFRLPPAL